MNLLIFFTKKNKLPLFLKPFFWSYDFSQLNIKSNEKLIIKNILNYGDEKSVKWLRDIFSETQIKKVIKNSSISEWDKKSLNLWSLFWDVTPSKRLRFK